MYLTVNIFIYYLKTNISKVVLAHTLILFMHPLALSIHFYININCIKVVGVGS